MKVVVVNDCAHVLEDILPYLRQEFDVEYIMRTRNLWSKTFGIGWKILKSKGDLYHVNYALQDAWLAQKLKHLDVLWCHGSDVRKTIKSKKWGWMVKSNLKKAKKVIYSTPDLELIKEIRNDAVYLPTPVRTDLFTPKSYYSNTPRALYFKLYYEELPHSLIETCKKYNIELSVLDKVFPYDSMPFVLSFFDIFVDRFSIPSLSKTCLEAMSCGLATIDYRHKDFLDERIKQLSNINTVKFIGKWNREDVIENHEASKVATQLGNIWSGIING
jgi:hypothetical protein